MSQTIAIVPVYNASKYLKRCIKSLLGQSDPFLKIILVNDASKDNSAQICNNLQKKRPDQIFFIDSKDNSGVEKTRLKGLSKAKEYGCDSIMFIDADDTLHRDALRILCDCRKKTNADVVQMDNYNTIGVFRKRINLYNRISEASDTDGYKVIDKPDLLKQYTASFLGASILSAAMWGKLYSADLLFRTTHLETGLQHAEDILFNLNLHPHIRRYALIDFPGYYYRLSGMTRKYNPDYLAAHKTLYAMRIKFASSHKLPDFNNLITADFFQHILNAVHQEIRAGKPKNKIIDLLDRELKEPIYDEIKRRLDNNLQRDLSSYVTEIYDRAYSQYLSQRKERMMKAAFNTMLQWF